MARSKRGMDKRLAKYQAVCPDGGSGTFSTFGLFDGISFLVADLRTHRVAGIRGFRMSPDALMVCHSRLGSIRFLLNGTVVAEIGEGETAVLRCAEGDLTLELPDGFFRGASLRLSLRSLTLSSRHGMSEFGIDLKALVASHESGTATVLSNSIDMSHTFSELYNLLQVSSPNLGYLRLKAFELLVLLESDGPSGGLEDPVASSLFVGRMQVAYRAQQVMTRRLSNPIGVEALAQACEVSPTVLKEAFREAFGVPVGTWYRSYRMHRACDLLLDERMPISEVATAVGYVSASKFSRAFADVKGEKPSEWRRRHAGSCAVGASSAPGSVPAGLRASASASEPATFAAPASTGPTSAGPASTNSVSTGSASAGPAPASSTSDLRPIDPTKEV